MKKVTLYSGSNRQGCHDAYVAFYELQRAISSAKTKHMKIAGSDSLERFKLRHEQLISRDLHPSSMSTLDDLMEEFNQDQNTIEYECCHHLLPMEQQAVKDIYKDLMGSDPNFMAWQEVSLKGRERKQELLKLRLEYQRLSALLGNVRKLSSGCEDKYSLRLMSQRSQLYKTIIEKNCELKELSREVHNKAQSIPQSLSDQYPSFSKRLVYNPALWDINSAWPGASVCQNKPVMTKDSLDALFADVSRFDDIFFKPLLVFYQMHHFSESLTSKCGISLDYNGVTMVIPASESGMPGYVFLEGDHRDQSSAHERYKNAAKILKHHISSLASQPMSSHKDFHFVDDHYARPVLEFFKKYPQLIPSGITLHCHYYNYYDHVIDQYPAEEIFKTIGSVSNSLTTNIAKGSFFDRSPAGEDTHLRNECAKTLTGLLHCVS